MKRTIYILLVAVISLSGCNSWLDDVDSEMNIEKKKALDSQEGFQDALTGAYIKMKGDGLYGKELVWGNIERLAQHWNKRSNTDPYITFNYIDATLERDMTNIYSKLYSVIADVNNILQEIDGKKDVFDKDAYELIKAEALGIRAYCHLDLLRLFGPIPGGNTTGFKMAYAREVSLNPQPHYSYQEYVGFLQDDLTASEQLFKDHDPILSYSISDLNKPGAPTNEFKPDNNYWAYRQIRMNYYAVLGLKARFYLWIGDKQNAYKNATTVMNATDPSGSKKFYLGTSAYIDNVKILDYSLSCEHIFAIYSDKLATIINADFKPKTTLYTRTQSNLRRDVFEKTSDAAILDMRYRKLWAKNENGIFTTQKWFQTSANPTLQLSLVRLAEMYFIAMETAATLDESTTLFNEINNSRAISTIPAVTITTETQLNDLLIKEYRREFYGEGQMFYAYKRKNWPSVLWASKFPGAEEVYVVPQPKTEVAQ